MTPAERALFEKRRRQRNILFALVLGALVILFYGITVARVGG
ncbi:hypothetical protein [Sandaracinobacteroides saxicola]|nr:hypothetical protein [Sandaracinobacteroides saxicola]